MNFIKSLYNDRLVFWAVIMSGSSVLTGFASYFIQILVARNLTVVEFGTFGVIASVCGLFLTLATSFALVVTKDIVSFLKFNNCLTRPDLLRILTVTLYLAIFLALVIFIFANPLMQFFKITNVNIILFASCYVFFSVFIVLVRAIFQASENFIKHQLFGYLEIFTKILFLFFAFSVTANLTSAFSALCLAIVVILPFGFYILWRDLLPGEHFSIKFENLKPKFYFLVLVSSLSFSLISQLDVALSKQVFTDEKAGYFISAAVLGKSILYLPGGIILALFPVVANADNEQLSLIAKKLFFITMAICLPACLIFFFMSEFVILIFYGENYLGAAYILKYYGFAMLPSSLMLVYEHYLIARGKVLFAFILLLLAPLQAYLILWWCNSEIDILIVMFSSGLIGLTVCFFISRHRVQY